MRATGVFFTLPAAFACRGLMPRKARILRPSSGNRRASLCAGRPNSAKSREHRLPAGESPGASRVSDITTDWDKPVQTLRRSLRTAIPRGRENASGPSLPDAKLPRRKNTPPARPGPSLVDHDLFLFGALSAPVSSCPLFCLQKHARPRSKTERSSSKTKPPRLPKAFPSLCSSHLFLFSLACALPACVNAKNNVTAPYCIRTFCSL